MKFSSIALFATSALAIKPIYREPTLVERQSASTIESDITAISAAAATLDTAIKGFTGASDAQALITASGNVVSAINKADADAKASAPLSQNEALALVPFIQDLSTEVSTVVNDLIAKKPSFEAAGLCSSVLQQVQSQQTAATAFQTDLIAKVPSFLQATAQGLAAPITAALAKAANAFKSCPTSSASSVPVSSAPASTSIPAYPTSTYSSSSSGSFYTSCPPSTSAPYTTTAPYSTGVSVSTGYPVPPYNGTAPTVSSPATPSSSIIPSNGGVKQAAGFGGVILAAVAVVAAL